MKPKKMLVWVPTYDPFIMGGSCHAVKTTEFPMIREFSFRGFKCACVQDAAGRYRVASISAEGALVSDAHLSADDACEAVLADIRSGDAAMMKEQVAEAKKLFVNRDHRPVKPEAFFA